MENKECFDAPASNWRERARYRRANSEMLRKSAAIALKVLFRLDELHMSQKDLAEKMEVTPQYVSKIVRGSENLTLETICKLEKCLDITLIEIPDASYTSEAVSSFQNNSIPSYYLLATYEGSTEYNSTSIVNAKVVQDEINAA